MRFRAYCILRRLHGLCLATLLLSGVCAQRLLAQRDEPMLRRPAAMTFAERLGLLPTSLAQWTFDVVTLPDPSLASLRVSNEVHGGACHVRFRW